MDILKKLGFGTMRLPVDENEDINYGTNKIQADGNSQPDAI